MAIKLFGHDNIIAGTADSVSLVGDTVRDARLSDSFNAMRLEVVRAIHRIGKVVGNDARILNVPLINYGVLSIFGYLLIKLTSKYNHLYTRSSLLATIATNVVLYGISDTCAQSITQFLQGRNGRRTRNDSRNIITLHNNIDGYRDNDEYDESNIFVDYGDSYESEYENENPTDLETGGQLEPPIMDTMTRTGFEFKRFFGFVTWGFIMAFVQVVWYMFLNAMFNDMPTIVSVLERDLTDQLLFSPISLACFFAYTTIVIEGGDMDAYKEKMLKLYVTTYAISFSVWFPVQFINFSIMPKHFQVPFSSSVGVIWNCFLSFRNAAAKTDN